MYRQRPNGVIKVVRRYVEVAVPGIRDCFPRVFGNTTRKMERSLRSECLLFTELIQWGEIYRATGGNHHAFV